MDIATMVTAIIGAITGVSGLVLGILNYNRDKPNIQITLSWDMSSYGFASVIYDEKKLWGVISITNISRRPIFFSHLHLEVPDTSKCLLISAGVAGEKLLEGDPPKTYPVTQEGLEEYADHWNKIRAVAIDSTGKKYYSLPAKQKPSWAN
jgi:hypothetical protein